MMPWMLLPERRSAASQPQARENTAWVLLGGLEEALQQAGVVSVLLAGAMPAPRRIFASGISIVNALLAASGRRRDFERGWETLRAQRFVATSALGSYPLLAFANGLDEGVGRALVQTAADTRNGGEFEPIEVRVSSGEGFTALPADPGSAAWRAALRASWKQSNVSAPMIATAVREAAATANRVVVLGVGHTLQAHPDVEAARSAAADGGTRLDFITVYSEPSPGLLHYLLPGSGAVDRLARQGRASAEAWLRKSQEAPRSQPHSVSEVSAAGSGPEPSVAVFETWRKDASDDSS